nr:hypothetical protein CFP56_31574 [Quercus suber]
MSPSEQQGSDREWKHVGRSKGRTLQSNVPRAIAGLMKDANIELLQRDFDIKLKIWRASSCRRQLMHFLETRKPDDGWCLENAICLGSHSFSRDNFRNRQRAVMQFVAFIDTVRYLQTLQDAPIAMYAQDPTYTSLDRTWLARVKVVPTDLNLDSLKVTGLGPARDLLQPTSLVFELFMEVGTEAALELFGSNMILYVGSSLDHIIKRASASTNVRDVAKGFHEGSKDYVQTRNSNAHSDVATRFQQGRRKLGFPTFEEDPTIFEGLQMYWKEPTDEDA